MAASSGHVIADMVTRPAFASAVARSVNVQPWPLSVGCLDAASLLAEQPVSVQLRYLHCGVKHFFLTGKNARRRTVDTQLTKDPRPDHTEFEP